MSKKPAAATEKPSRNERIIKRRELSQARSLAMHKARLLAAKEQTGHVSNNKLNVGCSGWFYWDWRGKFYPADLPTGKWFEHYTDNFDTVELNAPFYNWPTLNTVKTWLRQIKNKDFCYTVKVSELITHVKKFQATKTLVNDFQYIADLLGPAMGCFLFQLPPSYKYTYARLVNIVKQLNPKLKNVIEFRHESWWNETVYNKFKEHNIIFCACSSPKLPEDLIKTSDNIYIRFHGKAKMYRYDYSTEELLEWVKKIKLSKAKRVWAYFNNDFEGNAIKNAKEFIKLLNSELAR
jgi:uncharacterized protein YecE (DUF72 family)